MAYCSCAGAHHGLRAGRLCVMFIGGQREEGVVLGVTGAGWVGTGSGVGPFMNIA